MMSNTRELQSAGRQPVPLEHVHIEDRFWSPSIRLVQDVVIPYQYETLHDRVPGVEPSHAVRNFEIAAGRAEGEFGGMVFQDSDVAKWLEAAAYSLMLRPDAELEQQTDQLIELVAAAQQPDGYLNTYYTVKEPGRRWTNLTDCHELYCAGHMIEAATAYYRATGKRSLLDVVCRFVDHIATVFGEEEGKLRGYDGHQEIELALVKLYQVTGERRYLDLSAFFINERGQQPSFLVEEWKRRGKISHWSNGASAGSPNLAYHQAHLPVREQEEAVGHAVRAVYMYTAMADLALHLQDESLLAACRRLWSNVTGKQMYITGGIGSTHHGEAFTFDYDLPNDTVYSETCAAIGLIFFAQRMLQLEPRGEYADVMERALMNTVIAGMAQDGKHFFYVNPLEVWPAACRHNPGKHHVKPTRPGWFGCACCPPNVARLLTSLGEYVYSSSADTLYVHLYIAGETEVQLAGGNSIRLEQESLLPWSGEVALTVEPAQEGEFTLAVRLPGWSRDTGLLINGEAVELAACSRDGYAYITRNWRKGDRVELSLDMSVQRMEAHPQVRANAGKAALQRGPLVYCFEEADNAAPLASLTLAAQDGEEADSAAKLLPGTACGLPEDAVIIELAGFRESDEGWSSHLYRPSAKARQATVLRAVPYYLWGNRGEGEMAVWLRT
ncbi:glycoside hydrolase family 127 protein [Paenibacillus sp. SYP-B4298]|uniref:glycoside hydrolase family 127 protein n=1 Tax=Paenibacillus sp. SYP-B4298 TaxID=2996034 RepID=UPI003FA71524